MMPDISHVYKAEEFAATEVATTLNKITLAEVYLKDILEQPETQKLPEKELKELNDLSHILMENSNNIQKISTATAKLIKNETNSLEAAAPATKQNAVAEAMDKSRRNIFESTFKEQETQTKECIKIIDNLMKGNKVLSELLKDDPPLNKVQDKKNKTNIKIMHETINHLSNVINIQDVTSNNIESVITYGKNSVELARFTLQKELNELNKKNIQLNTSSKSEQKPSREKLLEKKIESLDITKKVLHISKNLKKLSGIKEKISEIQKKIEAVNTGKNRHFYSIKSGEPEKLKKLYVELRQNLNIATHLSASFYKIGDIEKDNKQNASFLENKKLAIEIETYSSPEKSNSIVSSLHEAKALNEKEIAISYYKTSIMIVYISDLKENNSKSDKEHLASEDSRLFEKIHDQMTEITKQVSIAKNNISQEIKKIENTNQQIIDLGGKDTQESKEDEKKSLKEITINRVIIQKELIKMQKIINDNKELLKLTENPFQNKDLINSNITKKENKDIISLAYEKIDNIDNLQLRKVKVELITTCKNSSAFSETALKTIEENIKNAKNVLEIKQLLQGEYIKSNSLVKKEIRKCLDKPLLKECVYMETKVNNLLTGIDNALKTIKDSRMEMAGSENSQTIKIANIEFNKNEVSDELKILLKKNIDQFDKQKSSLESLKKDLIANKYDPQKCKNALKIAQENPYFKMNIREQTTYKIENFRSSFGSRKNS